VNPKVGASCDPVDSWYPYYAGYSAGFVEQALQESVATAKLVLDPWNGTGTTTVVAASKNIPAIGFDVNPALVVVSRAGLLGAGVSPDSQSFPPSPPQKPSICSGNEDSMETVGIEPTSAIACEWLLRA
jgi:hypothetical protein